MTLCANTHAMQHTLMSMSCWFIMILLPYIYIFSVEFLYHVITVVTGTVLLVVLDNASSIFSIIVLK